MGSYYKCECGREFNNPQSFNGHKSHCIVHMEQCGKLDSLLEADRRRHSKTKDTMIRYSEQIRNQRLEAWIHEEHICENCGKIMTVKFGSGRFCCRACSNSHKHSDETKKKISSSIKSSICNELGYSRVRYDSYLLHPKYCIDCGRVLSYELKLKERCPECSKLYTKYQRSQSAKETAKRSGGNINKQGVRGRCKYGTYKGVSCDSSWELAFVYYCITNKIPIVRNTQGFSYFIDEEEHKYYPDFIIYDDELVEIKNYWTEEVQLKIDCIPKTYKYRVLYRREMKPYLDFVISKEGKNFCEKLYDRTKPSYLDRKKVNT